MKRAIIAAVMLAASITRVDAQDTTEWNAVVIEALREARKLVPEGDIGLATEGFPSDSDARAVAKELGMIARPRDELVRCLREPVCTDRVLEGRLSRTPGSMAIGPS